MFVYSFPLLLTLFIQLLLYTVNNQRKQYSLHASITFHNNFVSVCVLGLPSAVRTTIARGKRWSPHSEHDETAPGGCFEGENRIYQGLLLLHFAI